MNNLGNGAVLPSGLLSGYSIPQMAGFDKTYANFGLRVGIITKMFAKDDPQNVSKIIPEYEVMVFEQNQDKGATVITYRNCIAAQGFGSKADFLEFNYRKLKNKTSKGTTPSMSGQDGPIVLLKCVDGMSEKAMIVGAFPHPDRETTLINEDPHLEGEYNGANIQVDVDGATRLVFKGATDNDGNPLDSEQGPTTIKIEKDGSFQIDHKTITIRLDKQGDVTLKATGNINITAEKDVAVKATGDVTVDCKKATVTASEDATVEGKTVKLGKGASESVVLGDSFKKYFSTHQHPTAVGPSGPPIQPFLPTLLSKKVKTE